MIENIVKLNTVRTIMQNKLKYRKDLKRPLTSGEVDANFEFLAQAVSGAQFGIKDMVLPNAPAPSESGQYPVKQAGVYSGFKDSNGQAISVTADDFKAGIVYIIYNGTYSYKFIAPIPLDGEVAEGDMRGVSGVKVYRNSNEIVTKLSKGNIAISGQRIDDINNAIGEMFISNLKGTSDLTITNITIDLENNRFRVFIYQDGTNIMDTNYLSLKNPYYDNVYKLVFSDKEIEGYIVLNKNKSFATSGVTVILDKKKVTDLNFSPIILKSIFLKNNSFKNKIGFTGNADLNKHIDELYIFKDRTSIELKRLYVQENRVRLFIKTKNETSNSDVVQLAFDSVDSEIYGKVLTMYHTTKLEVIGYVVLKRGTEDFVFDGTATFEASVLNVDNSPKIKEFLSRKNNLLLMSSSTFGFNSTQNVLKEFLQTDTDFKVYNAGFGGCRMSWRTFDGSNNYDKFSGVDVADALVAKDFSKQILANTALNNTFKERLTDLMNVDLTHPTTIFVKYIDNDVTGNAAIGELWKYTDVLKDYDKTTFLGAMNYVIEKMSKKFPHIKWLFFSESWRYKEDKNGLLVPPYDFENSIGNKGLIYSEKARENCLRMGLSFFDFVLNGIQNPYNNNELFVDKTHLNYKGNKFFSTKLKFIYYNFFK